MQTNPSDGKQDESAQNTFRNSDIQDSQRDIDRLSRDEVTLDLPEVRDIPGQEHIHVLPLVILPTRRFLQMMKRV